MAGAKADNLPRTLTQKLHFLSKLQPKAQLIIQTWFSTNIQFSEHNDPNEILNELLLKEKSGDDVEHLKPLWRAILGFYVSQPCPEIIERFLNDEEMNQLNNGDTEKYNANLFAQSALNVTDEDIEQCLLIGQGQNISPSDRILPMFIAGLTDTLNGNQNSAILWKEKLATHPLPMAKKLEGIIAEFESGHGQKIADSLAVLPAEFVTPESMDDNIDNITFVGIVTKLLPSGAFFVTPIALFIDNGLRDLSEENAKFLYPHHGETVGFMNHFSRNFTQGELGIWQATHQPSDKLAQYVLTRYQSRIYPIIRLPHQLSEPDAIREWLLTQYQPKNDSPVIFLLDDGIALRLPGDIADPKKYDFDSPLDSYRELACIELCSRKITLATQLPTLTEKYDCAPASTWIKRLIKLNYSSIDFPAFSKAQLQNLAYFIESNESENDKYIRALAHLEQVVVSREFLDSMVQKLLNLPVVEAQINEQKKVILSGYENEQEKLRLVIASLVDKKTQLEAEVDNQKKRLKAETERSKKVIRQQEAELDSRIRQTFENASQAGIETLAQTALLRALTADVTGPVSQLEPMGKLEPDTVMAPSLALKPFKLPVAVEITNKRRLLTIIEEQAAVTGLSETLLSSIIAAANVTPIIGLLGKYTKKVLSTVANILSSGVRGEVSIHGDLFSISDLMRSPVLVRSLEDTCTMSLGDFLAHQQANGQATVVELRGFNRMPPETLLPELSDCLLSDKQASGFCWTDEQQKLRHLSINHPILFVLTFVIGKSTFPLQGSASNRLPVFLTENIWGDEQPAVDTNDVTVTYVTSVVWQLLYATLQQFSSHSHNELESLKNLLNDFGFTEQKSEGIAKLAFEAGRSPSANLVSDIESLTPVLMNYAREITQGEVTAVLDCLFQA
ncbi:hypothetical protein yrohd0001_2190 [Yersinia rohdei ATCC 43380]|nr:hypothetical protein yrohd0001_2190 [Yersinia rohdei ATCC 43380]